MTPFVWMFIKTYENLRRYIIDNKHITTLVQMEYSAFEEATVPICSFVLQNNISMNDSLCFRLSEFKGGMEIQKMKVLEAISDKNCGYFFETQQNQFTKIPGMPIAYWLSDTMMRPYYLENQLFGEIAAPCAGLATGDNNIFQRLWYEVPFANIGFGVEDISETIHRKEKWYPCNSGGAFRKWSTDDFYVVNWQNDGSEIKQFRNNAGKLAARPQNTRMYFKEGLTWNKLSSSKFAVKYKRPGYIFDDTSRSAFPINKEYLMFYIGLLCSCVTFNYLQALNPTMSFANGDLVRIPVIKSNENFDLISKLVKNNIEISKLDWDSFEISWDFLCHPLVFIARVKEMNDGHDARLSDVFAKWENLCNDRFYKLESNEEELNRIFIDIYGLQDELTPEVEEKDITVRKADFGRDIRSLISYAVGCMFGRYSLDETGLAYAGGEWDDRKYTTFIPDKDNCIPITDEAYFEDDIVGQFFGWMKKTFGTEHLEENLDFIAKALGNKGTISREVIRNYFLNDFIKDHNKIYQKRPIYWLFDSGKQNGFKALVYMHRWDADTVGNLRVEYLHKMQHTYEREIIRMQETIDNSNDSREISKATKRKDKLQKQLKETKDYDAKLAHIVHSRIEIDLDDGVKVNYEKVQTDKDGNKMQILAKI